MTTRQPEALRLADELCEAIAEYPEPTALEAQAAAELRRLHAYCQELESQVILDCMTHVQNPAEIEHVAGDVSKNGAGLNMSTQHARITELESQLAQRFDAADMATAAAQGFRDGVAKEQQAGAFQAALDIRTAQGWKLGGDKAPVLYTDEINGEQVCRDDVWLCTTAALASPPTAQAGSEPVASYAISILVAADLITRARADEALRLAAEITAAPGPADGESNG